MFTTDITVEDHQDFMRVSPPRPGQNAALLISHLLLIVVSVALLYSVGLFAYSLADVWRQDHLDVLLDNTVLLLEVAAGLLLLPIAVLFLRSAIRMVIQLPGLARTVSVDKSLLRDGLNTGPARFEVLPDGLRITMPLEAEQFAWSAFQSIRESDNILALMLDNSSGVIVPRLRRRRRIEAVQVPGRAGNRIGVMAARFELDFEVTPAQRADGNEFLANLAIIERHGLIGRLSRPPLFWIYGVPCTIVIVQNLTGLIGHIVEGRLPEGFGLMSVIGYAIALYFLGYEARLVWNWAGRRFGLGGLGWIGRKGVHWGAHRLTATADELIIERERSRSVYRWAAILGIKENRRALFLMLTGLSAIVVPKSAFDSPDLQQSFRDFVEKRIASDP